MTLARHPAAGYQRNMIIVIRWLLLSCWATEADFCPLSLSVSSDWLHRSGPCKTCRKTPCCLFAFCAQSCHNILNHQVALDRNMCWMPTETRACSDLRGWYRISQRHTLLFLFILFDYFICESSVALWVSPLAFQRARFDPRFDKRCLISNFLFSSTSPPALWAHLPHMWPGMWSPRVLVVS